MGKKAEFLIGQIFGRLTVVDQYKKLNKDGKERTIYLCKCSCSEGNLIEVPRDRLKNGKTKSCGCYNKEVASERTAKDFTGMQFGRWTVLERIPPDKVTFFSAKYICQCSCEDKTIKVLYGCSLSSGGTNSCGCLANELFGERNSKDLTGQRFGNLVALERIPSKKKDGKTKYRCICDCGNEELILGSKLTEGRITCKKCSKERVRQASIKDHTGEVYGRLTAIKRISKEDGNGYCTSYLCECSCEEHNEVVVDQNVLVTGKVRSCGCLAKEGHAIRFSGENSNWWKGGVTKKKQPLYDTYSPQLEPIEPTRRNPENTNLLQVQCYNCKEWMNPTISQVRRRIYAFIGKTTGESHFYCCEEHKWSCSTFKTQSWPRGYKPDSNRPYVDPYWREQVLANADYRCEICDSEDDLNAHHIQSATLNPMLANDVDNGICCCSQCHYDIIHSQPGCRPIDLQCNSPE